MGSEERVAWLMHAHATLTWMAVAIGLFVVLACRTVVAGEYPAWGRFLADRIACAGLRLVPDDQRVGWRNEYLVMLDDHRDECGTPGLAFAFYLLVFVTPAVVWRTRRDQVDRKGLPPVTTPQPPAVDREQAMAIIAFLFILAVLFNPDLLKRFRPAPAPG